MALVGTAGLFIPLHGELISVVQILVYLGAVAIAIIFMLMLSPPYFLERAKRSRWKIVAATFIAALVTVPLFLIALRVPRGEAAAPVELNRIHEIGRLMLSDFVFPFEIISLVLTVVIIGAIVIAREMPAQADSSIKTNGEGDTAQ